MLTSLVLTSLLSGTAVADDLSDSQTSYIGATMLESNVDFSFTAAASLNPEENGNAYAYFSGNTLYVGNEDDHGNTVDAIIEFFWFQSSIDRGADFFVAIVKARSNPGRELWVEDWWNGQVGESPVLSVEALCNSCGNPSGPDFNGAFRWDWAVPFDDYGLDAYGSVTFTNSYGLGGSANGQAGAEGAAMAHGDYEEAGAEGSIKAAGDVQVKGFVNSEYRVQTQYQVMLYEWETEVSGTADTMAWDMYLNLEAREEQQAYHEYFLPVQVEEGETFVIDEINVLGSFDNGLTQFTPYTMGVSLGGIEISAPYSWDWEEEEDDDDDWSWEEEEEESNDNNDNNNNNDDGDPGFGDDNNELPSLENESSEPIKSCSSVGASSMGGLGLAMLFAFARRRED